MRTIGWLAATHLTVFGAGWFAVPRDPLDTEVEHTGFFQVDTRKVLAATVESLREENRLLVFSYKGTAHVSAKRKLWIVLKGRQELIVPAVVSYYVDLSELTVEYEETAGLVVVRLPKLQLGDVAFQPEQATTLNGGLLTFSEDQAEELRKMNYGAARRSIIAQAQQPGLVKAAEGQAANDVQRLFVIPLRAAGRNAVTVIARVR